MRNCCCNPSLTNQNKIKEAENKKRLMMFRLIAPELQDLNDEVVQTYMDLYSAHLSKRTFGELYDQALIYYVAHIAKMNDTIASQGSTSGSAVAGQVTSEREGDLSRSYGGGGSSVRASSGFDGSFAKTAYGIEFMRIRSMVTVGVMTRFG